MPETSNLFIYYSFVIAKILIKYQYYSALLYTYIIEGS